MGEEIGKGLSELAVEATTDLTGRLGIDGAFVLVYRKGDGAYGCGFYGPTIPLEDLFATCIKALVETREKTLAAHKAAREAAAAGTPPPNDAG